MNSWFEFIYDFMIINSRARNHTWNYWYKFWYEFTIFLMVMNSYIKSHMISYHEFIHDFMIINLYSSFQGIWMQKWIRLYEECCKIILKSGGTKVQGPAQAPDTNKTCTMHYLISIFEVITSIHMDHQRKTVMPNLLRWPREPNLLKCDPWRHCHLYLKKQKEMEYLQTIQNDILHICVTLLQCKPSGTVSSSYHPSLCQNWGSGSLKQ